jgi:hypothetical protein
MKRLIVCSSCETKQHKLFPVESPYPGEHVTFVGGKAISTVVCDDCDSPINEGEYACAISIWADYGGVPYFPWESNWRNRLLTAANKGCWAKCPF